MSDGVKKMVPAYVPFDTFEGFVAKLQKTTVPHHIHKTLMPNLSGAIQGHLLASLKFLTLIDDNGDAQQSLHDLVQAHGKPEWKTVLATLIDRVYKPIIGDFDVKTAIPKTLQDKFKGSGAEGETVEKCIRFYLKALTAAGVEISPHLKVRGAATSRNGAPRKAKAKRAAATGVPEANATEADHPQEGDAKGTPPAPQGMLKMPIYIPGKPDGALIIIHKDLNEADCEMINTMLMAYAKRVSASQEEDR